MIQLRLFLGAKATLGKQNLGDSSILPFFLKKNLAICPCFETI